MEYITSLIVYVKKKKKSSSVSSSKWSLGYHFVLAAIMLALSIYDINKKRNKSEQVNRLHRKLCLY